MKKFTVTGVEIRDSYSGSLLDLEECAQEMTKLFEEHAEMKAALELLVESYGEIFIKITPEQNLVRLVCVAALPKEK